MSSRTSKLVAAIGTAGLLLAGSSAGAPGAPSASVEVKTTGNNSELRETIPIEARPGRLHTVMSMERGELPSFQPGDRLRVSSELMVTTDCVMPSARCAGRPHSFNPLVETRLFLVRGSREAQLGRDGRRCLQRPGDRQHHCVIVFHGIEAGDAARRLGCERGGCRIEVRVRASSRHATGRERLVIGGQKPDGLILQDRGRINAIRIRHGGAQVGEELRTGLTRDGVPPDLKNRVIYSQRLNGLRAGESLEAWVDARGHVEHLPYPALIGGHIVLAESPDQARGKQLVKRVASLDGEITETAGSNCTQAQTPCPVFRTGVVKMREDAAKTSGARVPLFVNFVVRTTAKRAEARPGDEVRFTDHGGLRVRRYPAP